MEHPFGKQVGGALCLDFVNTVRGRVSAPGRRNGKDDRGLIVGERIPSFDALLRWAAVAGLLRPRELSALAAKATAAPAAARRVLKRALALREALYRVFKCSVEGWTPEPGDIAVLNRELRRARARERLTASPRWRWEAERPGVSLEAVLDPIVRSAADLLTARALDRVGQCPGEECGWLFLDTSRSRRRQWCDMADCGNLAKVHRYRQKRRPAG